MKTLHILRHAKSAWNRPGQSDMQRELNDRGRRDAPRMGEALAKILAPLPVSASPAMRAQQTLEGLCSTWPGMEKQTHTTVEALYTFSGTDVLHWLSERENSLQALFVIGHNPGLTELINALTGRRSIDNLPTAGYVQLELAVDNWAAPLLPGSATISHHLFPRDL